MLCKRIIPCLDVKDGRVVKGVNFLDLADAGDPVAIAKLYYQQGADELVFLDITATHERRKTMAELAKKVAKEVFIPLTIGGGIRTVDDFSTMLQAGADKVAINSSALARPALINEAATKFGSQCVVVAMDVKKEGNDYIVYSHGGRHPMAKKAVDWAKQACQLGAGELLLTSMDRDGTKSGFDIELTRRISQSVSIPVIASGGAGQLEHFAEVLTTGKADAALAASLFHFQVITIPDLKTYLTNQAIVVRY